VRTISRFLFCVLAILLPLVGAQAVAAAAPAAPMVKTLHYDASGAPAWQDEITKAVQNWNADVHNVQLAAATGGQADFTLTETTGWPQTMPGGNGTGQIELGQQAVDEGFDKTRITAHEIGHILGLPDNRDGQCSTLMSGHSAPTSCKVADPNAAERAQVEQNFSGALRTVAAWDGTYGDCFTERASV
jgi:snapalysin